MEHIESAQNQRLKLVRRLSDKRARQQEGAFCVEGEDLVESGLAAGCIPRFVLASDREVGRERTSDVLTKAASAGADVATVSDELIADMSHLAWHGRIIAVFDLPDIVVDATPPERPMLLLDGVRDPGNVGTLVRAALLFGVQDVVIGRDTADPYGPKAVRASMGAVFHIRFSEPSSLPRYLEHASVVALDPDGPDSLAGTQWPTNPVIAVGSERVGLSPDVTHAASHLVRIPQQIEHAGRPDSLNAAMAGSIVLYEWSRRQS